MGQKRLVYKAEVHLDHKGLNPMQINQSINDSILLQHNNAHPHVTHRAQDKLNAK